MIVVFGGDASLYLFFLSLYFASGFLNLILSPERMPGRGLRYCVVTRVLCPYFSLH